jgi:hypothetical protein
MADNLPKVLVTKRPDAPDDKAVLETRAGVDDVKVVAVPWYKLVLVRVARTYLQGLLGFLVAGMSGATNVPAGDFGQLIINAAGLALAPAAVSLIQNAIEILSKLDVSAPTLRA